MARRKWEEWVNDKNRLSILAAWARSGMTDEEIAGKIGISRSTLSEWKKKHEAFREALSSGKEYANRLVESSLFEMTQGKTVTIKKAFKVRKKGYDVQGRIVEEEKLETADEEQYIPPDFKAIAFWLRNRMPDVWRDKIDRDMPGADEENNTGLIILTQEMTKEMQDEIKKNGEKGE